MDFVINELLKIKDTEYAAFQTKLIPTVNFKNVMGVRIPQLRNFAKSFSKLPECEKFLNELPHRYLDENLLHSILLCGCKPFEECINKVNKFLPYVDNWAVCDTISPKVFKKYKQELLPHIKVWINSNKTYTCRFGVDMLMSLYLDEDFKPDYLLIPLKVNCDEYYVNMMIAWFYATALAKQWNSTIPIIESNSLQPFIHNKTIQKACESYRITNCQKEYLKSLKIRSTR